MPFCCLVVSLYSAVTRAILAYDCNETYFCNATLQLSLPNCRTQQHVIYAIGNASCYRGGSGNLLSLRGIRLEWERMETWISSLIICTLYCFHTNKLNEL